MIFIESPIFTAQIAALVDDESYAEFQKELAINPEVGDVIAGTGGIRKVRMAAKGKGKRGGARVLYYYFVSQDRIGLLLVYAKGEKDNITQKEKKILASIVKTWRQPK